MEASTAAWKAHQDVIKAMLEMQYEQSRAAEPVLGPTLSTTGGQLPAILQPARFRELHDATTDALQPIDILLTQLRLAKPPLDQLRATWGDNVAVIRQFRDLVASGMDPALALLEVDVKRVIDISQSMTSALQGGFAEFAGGIGELLAGVHTHFKNFQTLLEGVLGSMLISIGQSLIATGLAGVAIHAFISNPFAAVAAGIALIALGNALASAATASVGNAGSALASGGGASAIRCGYSPAGGGLGIVPSGATQQGAGYIFIQGGLLDMSDARQAAAFSKAVTDLTGRRVFVFGGP